MNIGKMDPFLSDNYYCSFTMSNGSSKGTRHPMSNQVSFKRLSANYTKFLDSISSTRVPRTYGEASLSSHWLHAMNVEFTTLRANNTWELVLKPSNRKVIGSKWVFKIKYQSDGTIERYKARLLAKGYTQGEGFYSLAQCIYQKLEPLANGCK